MKDIKNYFIGVFILASTACCSGPKAASAEPAEVKTNAAVTADVTPAAEPSASAEKVAKFHELASQNEYIFSSETKTSTEKLTAVLRDQGLKEARALGGEQYFLKFNETKTEAELLNILNKSGLKGTLSVNQRYQAPPPGKGKKILKFKK